MISAARYAWLLYVLFACHQMFAFVNLDFEHASPVENQRQTEADLLPGWTVEGNEFGGSDYAYYNTAGHIGLYPAIFSIIDGFNGNEGSNPFSAPFGGVPYRPLQGAYSLYIDTVAVTASLSQVGEIPAYARSIQFMFIGSGGRLEGEPSGPFELFLGGTTLDLIALRSEVVLGPTWRGGPSRNDWIRTPTRDHFRS